MQKSNGAPTMKDVAREAGVALGTVSKVINGISVGESYRLRVEQAVEKLGYRVNSYARGLKNNQTFTVAVLVPDSSKPFNSKLIHCLNRSLSQRNYQMLLCDTEYDRELEQKYVYMAEQKKVDRIICLSYNPDLQVSGGVPFVSIDRYFGANIPCVACDNYGGGRMAVEKLVENGCQHLAFLRTGSVLTSEPNKRKDGFVSTCEALGIPYALAIMDDGTPFSAFEDFLNAHFHDGKLEFDGLFCVTDTLAYQIIRALKRMGLRVPEDVQVIGFDGMRYFGDMELFCSTIVQPLEEIADTCVSMLLNPDRDKMPTLICLPPHYAYGGTTKA